jgi:hypothetical protein
MDHFDQSNGTDGALSQEWTLPSSVFIFISEDIDVRSVGLTSCRFRWSMVDEPQEATGN